MLLLRCLQWVSRCSVCLWCWLWRCGCLRLQVWCRFHMNSFLRCRGQSCRAEDQPRVRDLPNNELEAITYCGANGGPGSFIATTEGSSDGRLVGPRGDSHQCVLHALNGFHKGNISDANSDLVIFGGWWGVKFDTVTEHRRTCHPQVEC